jgi:TatD DNase family protein
VLVDTHCHLDGNYFPEGSEEVLLRARAAGVGGFVCIGVGGIEAARQAVSLAGARDDVAATAGVHPHDAGSLDDTLERELDAILSQPEIVAVGEVGLDYHYDHSPREVQRDVFVKFIHKARALKKPLVIHTRSAPGDTLDLLESETARDVGGVIHCFSEDLAFARRAIELGFDLSFSGIVTFKNAVSVHEVARWAPADRILVETDSPYLAPVPMRGKRCEPAWVTHTARRVAELRGVPFEDLERQTTQNASRRFATEFAAPHF